MRIIKCLSEQIQDELDDAEKYVDLAMRWKAEHPGVAELFYALSIEEMGHMDRLHKQVQALIAEHRRQHGEPPKEMMVLYDYLHEKQIEKATEVRIKQGMFKTE